MKHKRHVSTVGLTTFLLLTAVIPTPPANAYLNEFQNCAAGLLSTNISPEQTSIACAEALHPEELSQCVVSIKRLTSIEAPNALGACFRVRRPIELASCVVDINRYTKEPIALDVLDHCRRSLLPIRFSDCVVGLSRQINDLSPAKAMDTCIAAIDWPQELSPTFAPDAPPLIPTFLPSSPPSVQPLPIVPTPNK